MKYLYILVCVACLLAGGCTTGNVPIYDTEIHVVIDSTDKMNVYPKPEDIIALVGLQDDIWQGVRVTVSIISDKDINDSRVFSLPKDNSLTGQSDSDRKTVIRKFKASLSQYFGRYQSSGAVSLPHSIIYRTIARNLNSLAVSNAKRKFVLAYTDCLENDEINFYNPRIFSSLQTDPQKIEKLLEKSCPLKKLTGIDLYLLYGPHDYGDNNRFNITSQFFKHLVEEHDCRVHIGYSVNCD